MISTGMNLVSIDIFSFSGVLDKKNDAVKYS